MKRGQKIDDGFHSYLIDYPGINIVHHLLVVILITRMYPPF